MGMLPPPTLTPEEEQKFWSRVLIRRTNQCWRWDRVYRGSRFKDYGSFSIIRNGKPVAYRATRIAFMLHYGFYPEQLVCHTCDRPWCVNPYHLFEGTPEDNMQDMIEKGRAYWQQPEYVEQLSASRITYEDARVIRDRWARYRATPAQLADEYQVGTRTINRIISFDILRDEYSQDVVKRTKRLPSR